MNDLANKVHQYILDNPRCTTVEIREALNISRRAFAAATLVLKSAKMVELTRTYLGNRKGSKTNWYATQPKNPHARTVEVEKIMAERYGNKSPDLRPHKVYIPSSMG